MSSSSLGGEGATFAGRLLIKNEFLVGCGKGNASKTIERPAETKSRKLIDFACRRCDSELGARKSDPSAQLGIASPTNKIYEFACAFLDFTLTYLRGAIPDVLQ